MPTRHLSCTRLALVACLAVTLSCAAAKPSAPPIALERIQVGFLQARTVPDGIALLPPPPVPPEAGKPAAGPGAVAAQTLDEAVMRRSLQFRDARWNQAIADADLSFPNAPGAFSCALGAPITPKDTPHLYALLARTSNDASQVVSAPKDRYNRTRPFVFNGQPTCTPDFEPQLRRNGSYPSGHTALGWTWALVLAEISPDRQDALLRRGWAYGESRIVCNVHWYSDVDQGRALASALVARLHAESAFRDEVKAAQAEVAEVRGRGLKPTRDCAQEEAALRGTPLFPVEATPRP